MELNKSSSNDDNKDLNSSSEDSSAKRIKLEKEIEDLKRTVKQLQQKLKIVKINNMKKSLSLNSSNDVASTSKQVVSMNIDYELYKYGGLYCVHILKNEYIIELNSSWKQQKQNLFAIQLFKQDKEIVIGKWVMPMSVDMKQLLSEVPLKTMRDVIPFLQNCKHHCNCYMFRLQQYQELKSSVDNLSNCKVQPNMAYTLFIIELLNVYDKINESYVNIIIYLRYNSINVRPTEIKLEVTGSIKYDEQTEKQLRKSLKEFHSVNLQTAFNNILKDDNVQFTWTRVNKEDTTLEINESSSSEDDLLSSYISEDEISRKRQKRRESRVKNKKKNKEQSSKKEMYTKASTSKSMKTAHSQRLSKVHKKIVKRRSKYTSSLDNFTIKLRPREDTSKMVQNNTKIRRLSLRLQKMKNNHTSTPIRPSRQNRISLKELPELDISDITDEEDTE